MALKAIVASLDDIDEALRDLYHETTVKDKDGKEQTAFSLDLEGIDSHPTVTALRNAHQRQKELNRALSEEVSALKSKVEALPDDFDVDQWNRFKADAAARDKNPDNLNEQLAAQATALRQQHESALAAQKKKADDKIKDLETALESERRARRESIVETQLSAALNEAGVKSKLMRAAKATLFRDVEVVEEDGALIVRSRPELGGEDVISYIRAWSQSDEGKEFIEPARGGDAQGERGNRRAAEPNPYLAKNWSKTAQAALFKEDRAKADRLAKAAGFKDAIAAASAPKPLEAA